MVSETLTRRGFVFGAAALVAGITVGCGGRAAGAAASQEAILRPPGAVGEELFRSLCVKCERCTSVCPEGVIQPLAIEGGVIDARGPELSFKDGCCTFCDLCRQVCPTAAIREVDPALPAMGRIGCATIHSDACLAYCDLGACGVCVEACPYGALSFDSQRRPVVDASRCNGCGACEAVCPAGVLTRFSGTSYRGIEVVTESMLKKVGVLQ